MLPYLPPHLFGGEDFGNEYLHGLDFTVELDFGLEFSGVCNADYFAGDIEYDCMSVDCLRGDVDTPAKLLSRKKKDVRTASTECDRLRRVAGTSTI